MRGRALNLILAMLAVPTVLVAANPSEGTWKLNLTKSRDASDVPRLPKSLTLTVQELDNGLKIASDQVNAEGKSVHEEYTGKYDGKDYPVTGSPRYNTTALKRISANAVQVTNKQDGKVVRTVTIVISKDGKTRTNTYKAINDRGELITWVAVFDKE